MSRCKICLLLLLVATSLVACSVHDFTSPTQSSTSGPYIENKGSDTMVNLALAWAEAYQKEYPMCGFPSAAVEPVPELLP